MAVRDGLGNILVLGLGKSGKSVVRYCVDLVGTRVDSVFIAAGAETDDSRAFVESVAAEQVDYAFGDDALARFADDGIVFDLCIASPGIPFYHDLYVSGLAHSKELISEVEFAWRESDPNSTWIAITGTNGKTTTTSCAAHVLQACGFAADAVGNIGDVCLDAVAAGRTRIYVAELSSYQLYSTRFFAPDVAVMLNITPDHLHWHRTLEAYRDAKFKLIDNMRAASLGAAAFEELPQGAQACHPSPSAQNDELGMTWSRYQPESRRDSVVVLDATNDVVRAKVRELRQMTREQRGFDYIPMGTADGIGGDMRARCGAENAAFIDDDGRLRVAYAGTDHVLCSADDLQIKGEHNASNALAAAAVAVSLGADDASIADALKTFSPLEHRIEPCGAVGGVECYNDSKATNTDATVKALGAFPGKRVIALLGGDDKGTDLADLVSAVHGHAGVAVCYGAGGPRFAQAFEDASADAPGGFVLAQAEGMESAVDTALGLAHPGDVLLLSPACASFDEFTSFEHRGRVFKQIVADRAARAGRAGQAGQEE